MKLKVKSGIFLGFVAVAMAAWAGYAVEGNGPTKSAAADDADRRAIQEGGCEKVITHAKLSDCRQEKDGSWTCVAYVANHESCN